ncbi:MAG: cation diffusion facilitator family transporter [Putridiphycobacter sp.]|nr:cation diffusion facilitator family transporter [Putridiphycobacter sp.]
MAHTHSHTPIKGRRLFWVIMLNLVITIGQLIGGLISGSLSLISDAIHNFTDVISLIISFFAQKISQKRQTLSHTFGFKRAEIIAASINGVTLIIVSLYLAYEAILRLLSPEEVETSYVIWLSLLAILGNGLSVILLHKDSKGNLNMKSAYLHLFSDLMVSVAVLIGGLVMTYNGMYWIDPVLTITISVYLLFLSIKIVAESVSILMLFAPSHISILEIEKAVCEIQLIKNIHHVHLWQLNDHDIYLEAHIEFRENISLTEFDTICTEVEQLLANQFNISHTMLQPEFKREDEKKLIIQD